jgi:predicted GNAT family acetyltransferase
MLFMDDTPTVRDNPAGSCFELVAGDQVAGRVDYSHRDGTLVLDHTEVEDAYSGRGFGSKLARGVFDELRSYGATVELACPFLERWIDKHPEYSEVVLNGTSDEVGESER